MSPVQAMERSYSTLREMLRAGAFVPGARLEANRLADELGVSMTPIRDALHQLVGERLVETSIGEGFRVPLLSEAELRDLFEWNSAILTMAVRTTTAAAMAMAIASSPESKSLADQGSELFARMASAVLNAELRVAILAANQRIGPFRMIEGHVLDATPEEIDDMARVDHGQVQAIRRYHLRRMRAAPDLVRYRARH
jgi:DNA-binding GntR family transcriptional regulator